MTEYGRGQVQCAGGRRSSRQGFLMGDGFEGVVDGERARRGGRNVCGREGVCGGSWLRQSEGHCSCEGLGQEKCSLPMTFHASPHNKQMVIGGTASAPLFYASRTCYRSISFTV